MGVLIFLAIIIILLAVLTQSPIAMAFSVLYIIAGMLALMTLFFIVTAIALLFFKRKRGELLRFEKENGFEHAVYESDDGEYHNLFPAEQVLKGKIYSSSSYFLLTVKTKKKNIAFDRHSIVIVITGLVFSAASCLLFIVGIPKLLG